MHGGVKFYRGSASAARSYVEADHSRADDYYLAEGTGVAGRYAATTLPEAKGRGVSAVQHGGTLDGDAYERWVAGYDVSTGAAKGRLRDDAHALRFVEVVVNGPKSWSLAAALHPDIATAYDAAMDRVATRRNDRELGVANRDTWTVAGIGEDGSVLVTGRAGERSLPGQYVREHTSSSPSPQLPTEPRARPSTLHTSRSVRLPAPPRRMSP